MKKINCDKYWDMEKDEKDFEEWTNEYWEYNYCSLKWIIEVKFNNWWEPVYLLLFKNFISYKYSYWIDYKWDLKNIFWDEIEENKDINAIILGNYQGNNCSIFFL